MLENTCYRYGRKPVSTDVQGGGQSVGAASVYHGLAMSKAEKSARTIRATVPPADRKAVIDRAAGRVTAKASIDFRREVRGCSA